MIIFSHQNNSRTNQIFSPWYDRTLNGLNCADVSLNDIHPSLSMGDNILGNSSCVKNIRAYLDNTLVMEKWSNAVSRWRYYHIRNIGKICQYTTDDTVNYSSRLRQCNVVTTLHERMSTCPGQPNYVIGQGKTTCLFVRRVKSYCTKNHRKYVFRRMISRCFGALRGGKKHHSLKHPCGYLTNHWPKRKLDRTRPPIWWQTDPNFRETQTGKIRFINLVNYCCIDGCISCVHGSNTNGMSFHR